LRLNTRWALCLRGLPHPEEALENGLDHLHEVGREGRAELLRKGLVVVDLRTIRVEGSKNGTERDREGERLLL
jgi:hypothetical protein